jgi:hypothetical protein
VGFRLFGRHCVASSRARRACRCLMRSPAPSAWEPTTVVLPMGNAEPEATLYLTTGFESTASVAVHCGWVCVDGGAGTNLWDPIYLAQAELGKKFNLQSRGCWNARPSGSALHAQLAAQLCWSTALRKYVGGKG